MSFVIGSCGRWAKSWVLGIFVRQICTLSLPKLSTVVLSGCDITLLVMLTQPVRDIPRLDGIAIIYAVLFNITKISQFVMQHLQ